MQRSFGTVAEFGLILLAIGSPAAVGGVHRVTVVIACLMACLTILAVWWHRRDTSRGLRLPWFGAVLLGAAAYTAVQLVPLPLELLRFLAPETVDLLMVSFAPLRGPDGWHPISLDPTATQWEVVKLGTCALALIAAHNNLYRRGRRDRLLIVLVAGGALLTVLGFLGAVAAPGRALMLYEPQVRAVSGLITTSFVNPNHAAAFFVLCTLIAVGLAATSRDLQQRVLLGFCSVLLGLSVFLSLSRGGIIALGVALGVFATLFAVDPEVRGSARTRAAVLVPGGAALILLLSGWLAFDAIIAEFQQAIPELGSDLGKIALWPPGVAMLLANPWVGVGRGAFATAFPRYLDRQLSHHTTFSHLENQYLHLPIEWGLLVGAVVIGASAVALVQWYRRGRRDALSMAMVAGLVALRRTTCSISTSRSSAWRFPRRSWRGCSPPGPLRRRDGTGRRRASTAGERAGRPFGARFTAG